MNQLKVNQRQSIIVLRERGWSQRRIARELDLDRATVRKYLAAKSPTPHTASETDAEAKSPTPHLGSGVGPGPASVCDRWCEPIDRGWQAGLSVQRIYQDLVAGEEFLTYHTNPKVGDSDGDGFLDGYEVLTGHLPLDIADKPALVAETRIAVEFTFPSAVGKTYRIEGSPDLTTWTTVESGIAGTGAAITRFYSTRNQP